MACLILSLCWSGSLFDPLLLLDPLLSYPFYLVPLPPLLIYYLLPYPDDDLSFTDWCPSLHWTVFRFQIEYHRIGFSPLLVFFTAAGYCCGWFLDSRAIRSWPFIIVDWSEGIHQFLARIREGEKKEAHYIIYYALYMAIQYLVGETGQCQSSKVLITPFSFDSLLLWEEGKAIWNNNNKREYPDGKSAVAFLFFMLPRIIHNLEWKKV